MKTLINSLGVLGAVFLIALVLMYPFAFIWAMNTLFNLDIAYTFWTWLASFLLTSLLTVKRNNE